jgi:hypothetical protein
VDSATSRWQLSAKGDFMRLITNGIALAVAVTAITVAPAAVAQTPFHDVAEPDERATLDEIIGAMSRVSTFGESTSEAELTEVRSQLDSVLLDLPRPTRLRGMVQMLRAGFHEDHDDAAAGRAYEEAIRLLPDDPRPKLMAAHFYTFSGAPARAADLLSSAIEQAPTDVVAYPEYELNALMGNLTDIGDTDRRDRLYARFAEIGYVWSTADLRSSAAMALVRASIAKGQPEIASRHFGEIGGSEFRLLYIDRRYEKIWPAMSKWAEPDLSRQHRLYLESLRSDWQATQSMVAANSYARVLNEAQAYQDVIDLFHDRLNGDGPLPESAELLVAPVARALLATGRSAEAVTLMENSLARATGPTANIQKLNIDANLVSIHSEAGNAAEAVQVADRWFRTVEPMGSQINLSAIAGVSANLACAKLAADPQADVAALARRIVATRDAMPAPAYQLYACQGDVASGRALVTRALANETTRPWALRQLQPNHQVQHTREAKIMAGFRAAMVADPALVASAEAVGRILPSPVGENLPDGFDPLAPSAMPSPVASPTT